MKVISYYKTDKPDNMSMGGFGYWEQVVAKELMALVGDVILVSRIGPSNSHDVREYDVIDGHFDIAYCELFDIPKKRPADFVFSIISDYIRMESELENWLDKTRPNVLFTCQYFRTDLANLCDKYNCECYIFPWFVNSRPEYINKKVLAGFMTGVIGVCYPQRTIISRHLESLGRDDTIVSMSSNHRDYPFDVATYRHHLSTTRFSFSGGIYDFQVPPKYYEICNHGAVLVSCPMTVMEILGFVDGETYVALNRLEDLADLLNSTDSDGKYETIALAGQRMVRKRHTIENRADTIVDLYNKIILSV